MPLNRRDFLKISAAGLASLGLLGCEEQSLVKPVGSAKVVVLGGGFGGAVVAKYLRKLAAEIEVTLIEANPQYIAAPGMKWILNGQKTQADISFTYADLQSKYGIRVLQERATGIDATARQVVTASGMRIPYDRLIVSPGVSFDFTTVEGYSAELAETTFPHAWKAGPQADLLFRQIQAMPAKGQVVISIPPGPFSCPVAPYERASLIASYLKREKPKARVVVLDANEHFPMDEQFKAAWKREFLIRRASKRRKEVTYLEHYHGPEQRLRSLHPTNQVVMTDAEEVKADVLNIIPPQRAGEIALNNALADKTGWCPVNPRTWESTLVPNVHVIGDAAYAGDLPKTAFAANSAAKACAMAVLALLQGQAPVEPVFNSVCYSLVTPTYGFSQVMNFRLNAQGQMVQNLEASGDSDPKGDNAVVEAVYAESWYRNITHESFS